MVAAAMVCAFMPMLEPSYADATPEGAVQKIAIEGVGDVYYVVNPAGIHGDATEYSHAEYSIPGIGNRDFRVMQIASSPKIAYYAVSYPALPVPTETGAYKQEAASGGIPQTLYGTAKMTWLEYWKNEGVSYLTEQTSDVKDGYDELDLGAFDTVSRSTMTYGVGHAGFAYWNKLYGTSRTGSKSGLVEPKFTAKDFTGTSGVVSGIPWFQAQSSGSGHTSAEGFWANLTGDTAPADLNTTGPVQATVTISRQQYSLYTDTEGAAKAYVLADDKTSEIDKATANLYDADGVVRVAAGAWPSGLEVTAVAGNARQEAQLNTDSTSYYLLDSYEVAGPAGYPVSVKGVTYVENIVKDAAGQTIPEAFRNVTVGGKLPNIYDPSDTSAPKQVTVTAETGLLKHLNDNGTYGKAAEGRSETGFDVVSNGGWDTVSPTYNDQWGDYFEAMVTLQRADGDPTQTGKGLNAAEWAHFYFNFVGARYDYYGDLAELGVSSPNEITTIAQLESKRPSPKASYGTKFAADTWTPPSKKSHSIELGWNFDAIRLGGTGRSTTRDGVLNYGAAQSKTGFWKVSLYTIGYNTVEKLIYIKSNYLKPEVTFSSDLKKVTLLNLSPDLRAQIVSGAVTVTLKDDDPATPDIALTGLGADDSYTLGSALSSSAKYSISVAGDSIVTISTGESQLVAVTGVSISRAKLSLAPGGTASLSVDFLPLGEANWGTDVRWTSGNPAVATVDRDGKVKAVAAGTAKITATANGHSDSCTVTVTASASGSGGTPATVSGGDSAKTPAAKAPTVKTALKTFKKAPKPKITGTKRVGKKLKVKVGTWSPKAKFTYQWYANGKKIKGATKATLTLKKAQQGKKIKVKVTGKRAGYKTKTVTSAATAKIKKKAKK
jgi:uncharacterized protein YjdB